MKAKSWKTSVLILAGTTLCGTAMAAAETTAKPSKHPFSEAKQNFERVQSMILREHMADIDQEKLYRAATEGMLRALNENGDRWNALLNPHEMQQFAVSLQGEITGIGIGIKFIPETGTSYIQHVLKDSPAAESDLQVGDQILAVNGKLFKGKETIDLLNEIRGPAGEKVNLKVLRGDQILEKTIERKKVAWGAVDSQVADHVGILRIRSFTQSSPDLVEKHLKDMNKKVKALVVDLRHNNGGLFDMAIASADHFLPKGKVIAIVRGKGGKTQTFISKKDPAIQPVPMVVLINRNTSSGAELLAASLKENLGVRLIGEKSFGKWNSQIVRRLPNQYAVKFTVYEFLSPTQKNYQNIGLTPDVSVTDSIAPGFINTKNSSSPEEGMKDERDRQLQTALQILQVMI